MTKTCSECPNFNRGDIVYIHHYGNESPTRREYHIGLAEVISSQFLDSIGARHAYEVQILNGSQEHLTTTILFCNGFTAL